MTFFQTYDEFIKESHQLNTLIKHSIQNRGFSIYDHVFILEFFHEQKGLWYCLFDLHSQSSRLLVTFDTRLHTVAQKWAQVLDLSIKQQRCKAIDIHESFPKLRMHFMNDDGEITHLIYSGHPIRPYVHLMRENTALLKMGHSTEEQINWKAFNSQIMTVQQDGDVHHEKFWQVIFNRIAFPYVQKLNQALQQKNKKITLYDLDQKKHEKLHIYSSFASYLLTLNKSEMKIDHLNFEGHSLPVHRHLSSGKNAAIYFKKAKKASHGLIEVEKQRTKNQEEIDILEKHLVLINNASLSDLEKIKEFLISVRLLGSHQKIKKELKTIPKNRPYFLFMNNQKFSFGKNQLQNDVVTFQIASKKDYFFHIANQSGSHVILHHPEPSHELILLAGKLVLSLANLNDGQVTYAPVKYIRKTKKLGLVKIEKHKMIHIKVGTDDLSEWIQTAKRY